MSFGINISDAMKTMKKFELLQIGDTGSGKTTRALTATRFGSVYFFDFDGKLPGACRALTETEAKKIELHNFKDKTFEDAFTKLKELKTLYDKGESPFATVVVDTFTILNEKAYVRAMGKKLDIKGSKATFDEWGVIATDLLNFFNVLLSLPCNIIVNAHVAKSENVEGKEVLGVEGMGSFRNRIGKRMSDSHYLKFELGKFTIKAAKSESVPANSCIAPKFLDKNGYINTFDLSVFDEYAYRNEGGSK